MFPLPSVINQVSTDRILSYDPETGRVIRVHLHIALWGYNTCVTTESKIKSENAFFCVILFIAKQKNIEKRYFRMASITQDMRFRLSLIKYAEKHENCKSKFRCQLGGADVFLDCDTYPPSVF